MGCLVWVILRKLISLQLYFPLYPAWRPFIPSPLLQTGYLCSSRPGLSLPQMPFTPQHQYQYNCTLTHLPLGQCCTGKYAETGATSIIRRHFCGKMNPPLTQTPMGWQPPKLSLTLFIYVSICRFGRDKHGCCWWPGAHLMPGYLQPLWSWWWHRLGSQSQGCHKLILDLQCHWVCQIGMIQ